MKKLVLLFALSITVITGQAQLVVDQMRHTLFKQTTPFNDRCPGGSAAGCGPIAIAQILYGYKTPSSSVGMASYTYGGNTVNVSLDNIVFDWGNILEEYPSNGYNSVQAAAIADLVYACGAAMNVSYNTSTSVTNYARMLYGLQHNLHISVDSRYLRREFYSTAEWIEMLNQQLAEGHPVFYRGTWYFDDQRADHMFMIDGVNANGDYHVNFGHGGNGDKYCDINYLNQSGTNPGNRGVCYNNNQVMLINAFPTPQYNDYPQQACVNEEPIILNKDTMLNQLKLNLGESFSLSCRLRNVSDTKFSINYGWALVKDGEFIKMLSSKTYGLSAGYTFQEPRHLDVSLPKTLADGNYILQLYSKTNSEETWREVWACAPTKVEVTVKSGKATVKVPDNHLGDPMLYLKNDIKEVDNIFKSNVKGRAFALNIVNPTTNNFQNKIRLDIVADGKSYTYETTQPIYSQTQPTFHILIPEAKVNLAGKNISSIKAYYYYAIEERYIEMGETYASVPQLTITSQKCGDIRIYTTSGILIKSVKAAEIEESYNKVLNSLPHGIYIVVEKGTSRKVTI